eukprot:scaffold24646_cov129-Isochrysis_galbana.AAC.14
MRKANVRRPHSRSEGVVTHPCRKPVKLPGPTRAHPSPAVALLNPLRSDRARSRQHPSATKSGQNATRIPSLAVKSSTNPKAGASCGSPTATAPPPARNPSGQSPRQKKAPRRRA